MTQAETKRKDWTAKRDVRLMVLSATQIETFRDCRRRWWLEKVRGLPVPAVKAQVFGTILHSVCERYLSADDLGNDPKTGKPVELYPEGWHIARSRYNPAEIEGEATLAEQNLIKKLIAAAIEQGVLERHPGRTVESEFRETVLQLGCPDCGGNSVRWNDRNADQDGGKFVECPTCRGDGKGDHVQIVGVIDLAYPDRIEDHKTVKDMKWAKSQAKLRTNPQILIYAKAVLLRLEREGKALPDRMTLRHNVYCKDEDKPQVRKVEVTVTREEIEAEWQRVQEDAQAMSVLRKRVDLYHQIPEPANMAQVCNKYGGCHFRDICAGRESVEGYEARLARHQNQGYTSSTPTAANGTKGSVMSDFAARLAAKKEAMKNAQAATTNGAATPTINPAPPAQPQAPAQAPPAAQTPPVQQQTPAPPPPDRGPANGSNMIEIRGEKTTIKVLSFNGMTVDGEDIVYPPWACGAPLNGGLGFNNEGAVCRISRSKAANQGLPSPDLFTLEAVGDGTVYWIGKEDTEMAGIVGRSPLKADWTPDGQPPVKVTERVEDRPVEAPPAAQAPPPAQTPAQTPPPAAKPAPVVPAAPKAAAETIIPTNELPELSPEDGEKSAGRPKKGFILVINGGVTKGSEKRKGSGRYVYDLHDVLETYGKAMAKQAGVESFYEINAFTRRDALAKCAPMIAEQFGTDIVVVSGVGSGMSDIKALVDALRPLAGCIIQAEGF